MLKSNIEINRHNQNCEFCNEDKGKIKVEKTSLFDFFSDVFK